MGQVLPDKAANYTSSGWPPKTEKGISCYAAKYSSPSRTQGVNKWYYNPLESQNSSAGTGSDIVTQEYGPARELQLEGSLQFSLPRQGLPIKAPSLSISSCLSLHTSEVVPATLQHQPGSYVLFFPLSYPQTLPATEKAHHSFHPPALLTRQRPVDLEGGCVM